MLLDHQTEAITERFARCFVNYPSALSRFVFRKMSMPRLTAMKD